MTVFEQVPDVDARAAWEQLCRGGDVRRVAAARVALEPRVCGLTAEEWVEAREDDFFADFNLGM